MLDQQFERDEEPRSKGAVRVRQARRSRPTSASATRGSRRSPTSPTGAASHGCSRACATCTIRCAPRRRKSTSSRACVLLREIQRTGDIFFPKRWMDATLSGHQSAAAAATVRAFVDRLPPDYPERLRRVILSSADDLFRASRNGSQLHAPTGFTAARRPKPRGFTKITKITKITDSIESSWSL